MKAVLFDLDGTLIDTAADFIRIIQDMCREKGVAVVDADLIRSQVSEGARAMVKLVYPELEVEDPVFLAHRQRFLDIYGADIAVDTDLFSGMYPLLEKLESQEIPWGIVTNKPRYLAEQLLDKMQLRERCAALVCPEDVSRPKPDPEPMYMALEKLSIPRGAAGSVLYVGDHIRDIEAGNAAGMPTILAAYGYIPPEDQKNLKKWGANYIVETPKQLNELLLTSGKFEYL